MKCQIAFLMDRTESMYDRMVKTQTVIRDTIRELSKDGGVVEVAFVAYSDFNSVGNELAPVVMDFTADLKRFEVVLDTFHYHQDYDTAENVALGLQETVRLSWDASEQCERIVMHLTDAPPHGEQFHEPWIEDRYPKGDPRGREIGRYLLALRGTRVFYHLCSFSESTDVFAGLLKRVFGDDFEYERITDSPSRYRVVELDDYTQSLLESRTQT